MKLALVLLSLVPIVVYLDVVKFNAPVLTAVAVLVLPLILSWALIRRAKKHALSKQTLVFSGLFLTVCPVLTLFFANQQEQRIAEHVRAAAASIAQYKGSTGRYPNSLKEVEPLAATSEITSERNLQIGGRVVSYWHTSSSATDERDKEFAKLSYWSFGFYQRQIFDVGKGSFDLSLRD